MKKKFDWSTSRVLTNGIVSAGGKVVGFCKWGGGKAAILKPPPQKKELRLLLLSPLFINNNMKLRIEMGTTVTEQQFF